VEPEVLPDGRERLGIGLWARDRYRGIRRDDPHEDEDDQSRPEERRHGTEEAGENVAGHAAYEVGSGTPACANATRRSAHFVHRPQWRTPRGRAHDSVSASGSAAPRRITASFDRRRNGARTLMRVASAWLATRPSAARKAGVASGNGLSARSASATTGIFRCAQWTAATLPRRRFRPGRKFDASA